MDSSATENGFQPTPAFNGDNGNYGLPLDLGETTHINGSNGLAPTPPVTEELSAGPPPSTVTAATKVMLNYTEDFPKLPDAPVAKKPLPGAWGQQAVRSTTVTEAITFTAAERASKLGKRLGDMSEEQQKCHSISQATGAKIELSEARDHSLTVLLTGKKSQVDDARSRLLRELQTQTDREIHVPKEYRGVLIGKAGANLSKLEQEFACKIFMPSRNENSDMIKIHGPPSNIDSAVRRIEQIVGDLAKQATETISIPRNVYPWVRGPANENLDRLQNEYAVKINIPPATSDNDKIVINGEREGVYKVVDILKQIYESKKNAASITCNIPRVQHRYILGTRRSGIDEILRQTEVVVDVPPENDTSDVITLRGDTSKLATALALVYQKATSVITKEIKYEEWQRRFLIGPKGATLQSLVPNQDKLKIDFEDGGVIYLEGSPEQVNTASQALEKEIERLSKDLTSEIVTVPVNLHRHIIGKSGSLVTKLKNENDVNINIPDESKGSNEIRIEGKKDGVKKAIAAIKEIVQRLENEKSRDIIIEQRFHGNLIGKHGETINKWRQEFPTVTVNFPNAMVKSDIVNLRGDKKEVDNLFTVMTKLQKELQESNYQETVPIFKEYYKHIVGKGGANINKIREETGTRIELPTQGSTDNRLTVVGKKAAVEKAIEKLNKIQTELASVVTAEVDIANKLHARLLGHNRRLIRDIEDENGGVHVQFPKEKSSSKVIIRGPKDDVAKAEKALKDLAKHCEETTEEASVPIKSEYIRFLIGREGANVKKMRESYPSVRIMFPEQNSDQKIVILGKKDEVEAVRKSYEKQIQELNEAVEIQVSVDPKYHKHFVSRSAEIIKKIQETNGGVTISFPRQETKDDKVTIKGSKQCAESAKQRIEEIVDDLVSQVTVNVSIDSQHHRAIVPHANQLRDEYNVRINFPARGTSNEGGATVEGILPSDHVTITGRDTKVAEAQKALMELIPITQTINVPVDFHSSLIGKGGEAVRQLMTAHAVRVKIPSADENSEEILVTGAPANVEAALENIRERMKEFEGQAEDRKLRSFVVHVNVPSKYHQRLIGPGGSVIREMQKRHSAQIKIPRSEDSDPEVITITSYEDKANECKKEIEDLINGLENMISQEVTLAHAFHPRLIGKGGKGLRKIQDDFKVEIRLPRSGDPNPDIVVVSGKNEDDVVDCISKLRQMEEDFMEDYVDRNQYMSSRQEAEPQQRQPQHFEIQGAPWQLDNEQFPAMGGPSEEKKAAGGVWGQRRF
uniref:K Homology domain-containing protein n=1 Tax=Panagrolaimus superbus TaxID=310955 RepID=A0A914Y922_9BILA